MAFLQNRSGLMNQYTPLNTKYYRNTIDGLNYHQSNNMPSTYSRPVLHNTEALTDNYESQPPAKKRPKIVAPTMKTPPVRKNNNNNLPRISLMTALADEKVKTLAKSSTKKKFTSKHPTDQHSLDAEIALIKKNRKNKKL